MISTSFSVLGIDNINLPKSFIRLKGISAFQNVDGARASQAYQYMNTKQIVTSSMKLQVTFSVPSVLPTSLYFGALNANGTFRFQISVSLNSFNINAGIRDSQIVKIGTASENTKYTASINLINNEAILNGDSVFLTEDQTYKLYYAPIAIFARGQILSGTNFEFNNAGNGTLYRAKIYDNNKIIHDYVPVQCVTDVINLDGSICLKGTNGLYDICTGSFLSNAGSGDNFKAEYY